MFFIDKNLLNLEFQSKYIEMFSEIIWQSQEIKKNQGKRIS